MKIDHLKIINKSLKLRKTILQSKKPNDLPYL